MMKTTITIIDNNGETTSIIVDLDHYVATGLMLDLIATVSQCDLSRALFACATVGLNALVLEYSQKGLQSRVTEFHSLFP